MTVNSTDNNEFNALASVLEDYAEWFTAIALQVSYIEQSSISENFSMPSSFENWLADTDVEVGMSPVVDIHAALKESASAIINSLGVGNRPSYKDFVEFKNLYNSFFSSVLRLETDSSVKDDGADNLIGLRPVEALKRDLSREMERLSRNGNPFSLVMVRIDEFENSDSQAKVALLIADNIKKSLRPFDDAYYLGEGSYLLSLKHADMVGAETAVVRVQKSLSIDDMNVDNATISCCMSEPVSGDDIPDLLKNMKTDLSSHVDDHEVILKFQEMSPLERFIGTKS